MEPGCGLVAVTYTGGRMVGTTLDRNGLLPARYVILANGCVSRSGEVGAEMGDCEIVRAETSKMPASVFTVISLV